MFIWLPAVIVKLLNLVVKVTFDVFVWLNLAWDYTFPVISCFLEWNSVNVYCNIYMVLNIITFNQLSVLHEIVFLIFIFIYISYFSPHIYMRLKSRWLLKQVSSYYYYYNCNGVINTTSSNEKKVYVVCFNDVWCIRKSNPLNFTFWTYSN